MKILKKSHIIERDEVEHTKSERAILAKNNACPFLVGLKVQYSAAPRGTVRRRMYHGRLLSG
jgi:serum/glucocorticoid-regulated kinase 2